MRSKVRGSYGISMIEYNVGKGMGLSYFWRKRVHLSRFLRLTCGKIYSQICKVERKRQSVSLLTEKCANFVHNGTERSREMIPTRKAIQISLPTSFTVLFIRFRFSSRWTSHSQLLYEKGKKKKIHTTTPPPQSSRTHETFFRLVDFN
jgi:hypothetical protein